MVEILKIQNNDIDDEKLKKIGKKIKEGKIAVFPTETVYGIGASIFNEEAIKKIYIAKKRPSDNPLIAHISNFEMLKQIVDLSKVDDISKKLIEKFFPGPFTIILPKKEGISKIATAGNETIGVRMPINKIANKLINLVGVPIVAPSANVSGKPSGTCVEDIIEELKESVDYIVDSGNVEIGIESTVVKVDNGVIKILRPGYITKEDIEEVIGNVKVEYVNGIFEEAKQGKVESPGLKHRHYSPDVEGIIIYSNNHKKMMERIFKKIDEKLNKNEETKICVLGFKEDKKEILKKYSTKIEYIDIGKKNELETIAKNIFSALRMVDKKYKEDNKFSYFIVEGIKKEGFGIAIMNRLIRAVGYNEEYN